jgi:hypothetical protein
MKILITFCILVLLLNQVRGSQEQRSALSIAAEATVKEHRKLREDGSPEVKNPLMLLVSYGVIIKNTGTRSIRIPTSGFRRRSEVGVDYTNTELIWELQHAKDGAPLVASECEYKPTEIRPGECSIITWQEVEFRRDRFIKIIIKISAKNDFSRRYGFESIEAEFPCVVVDGLPEG